MDGRSGRTGSAMTAAAAAVAVAVSGMMAAGGTFAGQGMTLALRGHANDFGGSSPLYLRSPSYTETLAHDGRAHAAVIGGLRQPRPGNFESGTRFATAITAYIGNDGSRCSAMTRGAADAVQAFHIHGSGRLDGLAWMRDAGETDVPVDLLARTAQAWTCLPCCRVADGSCTPAAPQIRAVNAVAVRPQYPEPGPEPQREAEQGTEQEPPQEGPGQGPESGLPAIVRQYDADGCGVMGRDGWLVAMADYAADPQKLNLPQIPRMAAHRGQTTPGACTP